MIKPFVILSLLILAGASPLSALAQDDKNIEINLDVIDRFAPPKQAKQAPRAQAAKGTIPAPSPKLIRAYPDGTLKPRAIVDYERSLESLRAKYFPQQPAATAAAAMEAPSAQAQAAPNRIKEPLTPAPRKIEPIPAPAYPPPRQAPVAAFTETPLLDEAPIALPTTEPAAKIIDKASLAPSDMKAAPDPSDIKGLKIVSIAYIDEEINLNPNVQNALITTYIPRLQAQQNHRVGLYSYASTLNRSEKEANRLSLERAIALKNFLSNSGIDGKRIDIFPAGRSKASSFSDWIDIIVEK